MLISWSGKFCVCGVALAVGMTAASAFAEDTSQPSNGLMTFPNVRVIAAPKATPASVSAASPGMRAFIDPQTGALVGDPSAEAIADLQALRGQRLAQAKAAHAAAQMTRLPSGAAKGRVDPSKWSYSVVRRSDEGIDAACVDGSDNAMAFLRGAGATTPRASRAEVLQ